MARVQDGTYDFIDNVLAAVRAPGVMREDVLAFRNIAQSVQRGELSSEVAAARVAEINSSFAVLWKWMNDNSIAITLVLTIIALCIAILTKEGADEGSYIAHQDAQRQLQVEQRIYEALRQRHAPSPPQATGLLPTREMPRSNQTRTQEQAAHGNRKARRAAAARARRQPPA